MTLDIIMFIINTIACVFFLVNLLKHKVEDLGYIYTICAVLCWFNEALYVSNLINSLG